MQRAHTCVCSSQYISIAGDLSLLLNDVSDSRPR